MFKSVFAQMSTALSMSVRPTLVAAYTAGPYVNVETNAGWTGLFLTTLAHD